MVIAKRTAASRASSTVYLPGRGAVLADAFLDLDFDFDAMMCGWVDGAEVK